MTGMAGCEGETHKFTEDGAVPVHLEEGGRAQCLCGQVEALLQHGQLHLHATTAALEQAGLTGATHPGFLGLL